MATGTVLVAVVLSLSGFLRAGSGLSVPSGMQAEPPPRPSAEYTVWQWNVAGAALHQGRTDDGLIEVAAGSIEKHDVDFASINELCRDQYDALVHTLRKDNWLAGGRASRFAQSVAGSSHGRSGPCHGHGGFGNAVFSKHRLGGATVWRLPADSRTLVCAPLAANEHVRYCTTHITIRLGPKNSDTYARRELDFVRHKLDDYRAAGDTVIISGDFNAQPNYARLDSWYARAADEHAGAKNTGNAHNHGAYRELDEDHSSCRGYGEWTNAGTGRAASPPACAHGSTTCKPGARSACKKIDMIFVNQSRIVEGKYSADVLPLATTCKRVGRSAHYAAGSCSDHRILLGHVKVYTD